jgi:hypothetical protein
VIQMGDAVSEIWLWLPLLWCLHVQDVNKVITDSPSDAPAAAKLKAELDEMWRKHLEQLVRQQKQQQQQQTSPLKETVDADATLAGSDAGHAGADGGPDSSARDSNDGCAVLPVQRHAIVIDETDGSESTEEAEEEGEEEQEASAELQQQSVSAAGEDHLPTASQSSAVAGAGQRAAQHILQHLTAPRSSQDFCKTAKMLDATQPGGHQQLGQYVKLLHPGSYKAVFKRDLSEQALQHIVAGLAVLVMDEPSFVGHALLQLTQVERFNIVLHMVLASKTGQRLKSQLQLVMQQLQDAGQEVADLKRLYRLP